MADEKSIRKEMRLTKRRVKEISTQMAELKQERAKLKTELEGLKSKLGETAKSSDKPQPAPAS